MKVEMKMPDLSTAGTTVKVIGWLVELGQEIKRGQPLLEVETDKATMEVEAYLNGMLLEIVAPPETVVDVGQSIAVIETADESPEPLPQGGPEKTTSKMLEPVHTARPEQEDMPRGMFNRNRQKAAESVVEASPVAGLSTVQRVVGQRMVESKQTIPHFYLQTSVNADPMATRRSATPTEKPAWDAFIACAVGKALKKYERMRVSFQDGKLVPPIVDAVGIAVDLDGDLFVIPIYEPAVKSPEAISSEIRQWVIRIRAGNAEARKIHATNFTISNLGATGIEAFTAIINPPETAILAVGKISPVVVAVDGQISIQQRVTLILSVDHRVVNGRYAAEFLQCIVTKLESM